MTTADWGDIYKELGAKPVINATGSVTMLGGSTPIPEVREAMAQADGAYIPLMELQEAAGGAIARMVNVPAAYITSGAGSALMLATAAAMAGDDDDRIQQLPNTNGMKNEVLIQTRQRYWYDRCLELAGAKLVMFGSEERTTPRIWRTPSAPTPPPSTTMPSSRTSTPTPCRWRTPSPSPTPATYSSPWTQRGKFTPWRTSASTSAWARTSSASPPSTWARPSPPAWPWAPRR